MSRKLKHELYAIDGMYTQHRRGSAITLVCRRAEAHKLWSVYSQHESMHSEDALWNHHGWRED